MQSALPIPPTIMGRCEVSLHPRKRCNRPAFTVIGARYYCGHCCDLVGMRSEVARGLDHFPLAVDRTGGACFDVGATLAVRTSVRALQASASYPLPQLEARRTT